MISKKIEVVLVDKNDRVVGFREKYAAHHHPVPLHRAVSVLIIDKAGLKMLLQRRAGSKPTWPLYWSNASCTHPLKDESYLAAAERRLKEEMGIETKLKKLFSFVYEAKYDEIWGEHELDHVFAGRYEGKIVADPGEAADYKWMDVEKLKQEIKESPETFTPWFRMILGEYLRK